MRRRLLAVALVLGLAGAVAGGLTWLGDGARPQQGASRGEVLYAELCATCHGASGRGSWRATLFLVRPGNLADRARMRSYANQYLFELIKHGGAPIGRPGMPAFGATLSDEEIRALLVYVRSLSAER